jgi:hypothetical protein
MLTSLSSGFSCARMPSPVSVASASPSTIVTFASNAPASRTAASAIGWASGSDTAIVYSS